MAVFVHEISPSAYLGMYAALVLYCSGTYIIMPSSAYDYGFHSMVNHIPTRHFEHE